MQPEGAGNRPLFFAPAGFAAVELPKGMYRSVWWSFLFGDVMVCAFVLAMPSTDEAWPPGPAGAHSVM
jgi:hypothetical protein